MDRAIVGFHQDDVGDWVAELACGHQQHVRHRPPFQERPWVIEETGRSGRLGTMLQCPLCDEDFAERAAPEPVEEGGDPACWAGMVCPHCGAMLDGSPHRPECKLS